MPKQNHHNDRVSKNIPEVIVLNKLNYKDAPPAVPEEYPVLDELTVIWMVSLGQLGKGSSAKT